MAIRSKGCGVNGENTLLTTGVYFLELKLESYIEKAVDGDVSGMERFGLYIVIYVIAKTLSQFLRDQDGQTCIRNSIEFIYSKFICLMKCLGKLCVFKRGGGNAKS